MDPKIATSVVERREQILAPLDPARYTTLARLVADEKTSFVVSLGGGSVPGLAGNIALVRIFEELGLRPRIAAVWGTSAGAAVGGPWASGTAAQDILSSVQTLDRKGAVDLSWPRIALTLLLRPFGAPFPDGLIRGQHFSATVDACLKVKTFEECDLNFRCIACTDDGESRRKVFRRGALLPAIFSSMSMPGIVVPRGPLPGEETGYYDGGLVEKTPLISPISEHLQKAGGRKLLLVATHFGNDARRTPARGFVNRFLQSIYALEALAWDYQLAEARSKPGVTLMVLNPHIEDPALFDFSRVERNYLQAREVFADLLQNARIGLSLGLE